MVARLFLYALCTLVGSGCADGVGALKPETFTLTTTRGHDDINHRWDRTTVGGNFTWRLSPLRVSEVPPAFAPGEGEAP